MKTILLAGLPRSGTTWIAKTLDSAPTTLYLHEPDLEFPIPGVPPAAAAEDFAVWETQLRNYVRSLPTRCSFRTCGKPPFFPKDYFRGPSGRLRRWRWRGSLDIRRRLARQGIRLDPRDARWLGMDAEQALVWKSVSATGILGSLAQLPELQQVVHIVRHPCGFIASVLRGRRLKKFGNVLPDEDFALLENLSRTAESHAADLSLTKLRQMPVLDRLAWAWALLNQKAQRELREAEKGYLVHYDDFCLSPQQACRDLFSACGVQWSPQTERFVAQSTGETESHYYAITKDPRTSAQSWQRELSAADVAVIRDITSQTELGRKIWASDHAADPTGHAPTVDHSPS